MLLMHAVAICYPLFLIFRLLRYMANRLSRAT